MKLNATRNISRSKLLTDIWFVLITKYNRSNQEVQFKLISFVCELIFRSSRAVSLTDYTGNPIKVPRLF